VPLFDLDCPQCGLQEDVLVLYVSVSRDYPCPDCDFLAQKLPSVMYATGILPSKPLEVDHAGLALDSNQALRDYKKKNPESNFVDRKSTYWKNKVERLHSRREVRVQKQGFRDFEHFKTEKRKESSVEKKPNP